MSAIQMSGLTKKFGNFTAVDSIDLEINEGEIFGLLGPNGAGKTTTISMLCTLLKPTSGTAIINGFDVNNKSSVRKSIGIVFQDQSLDDELTGRENLDFHGRLYKVSKNDRKQRIDEVLKLVDLTEKSNDLVKTYSGGMKRRLEIARGFLHHPKILFLDEPTLGLDPGTRRVIWDYIKKLNHDEKMTIIITTHYMEEADYLCDRIAIVDHGKIVMLDTPENLKNVIGGDLISLETAEPEKLKGLLKFSEIKEMSVTDKELNITTDKGETLIPKIMQVVCDNNLTVTSVHLKKPTLEDVFIKYTGHAIRDESADEVDRMRSRMRIGMRR